MSRGDNSSLGFIFNIDQIYAWQPGFDRNNLSRWTRNGLLIRLRQSYYTFPEYKSMKQELLFGYALKPMAEGRKGNRKN